MSTNAGLAVAVPLVAGMLFLLFWSWYVVSFATRAQPVLSNMQQIELPLMLVFLVVSFGIALAAPRMGRLLRCLVAPLCVAAVLLLLWLACFVAVHERFMV